VRDLNLMLTRVMMGAMMVVPMAMVVPMMRSGARRRSQQSGSETYPDQ